MSDFIVTADPPFADSAWDEVRGNAPGARRHTTLADGVTLAGMDGKYSTLGERWRQNPPIFVRHICPVDTLLELNGDQTDLTTFVDALDPLLPNMPNGSFSVQTRILADVPYKPFDVNKIVSHRIKRDTTAVLDVRSPETIVSIVVATVQGALVGSLGISAAFHNLSDWAGGMRRFKREPDQVSRAEFKLLEALEQFNITLPSRAVAIDLGAAPGGWTRVLRMVGDELLVVAVDPGELHPSLQKDWGVHVVRKTAEAHLRSLSADTKYNIIVNDMRLDAWRSAQTMCSYAKHLAEDGFGIMTIKLRHDSPLETLDNAYHILEQQYTIARARQLFHNRHEITVLLTPLAS